MLELNVFSKEQVQVVLREYLTYQHLLPSPRHSRRRSLRRRERSRRGVHLPGQRAGHPGEVLTSHHR